MVESDVEEYATWKKWLRLDGNKLAGADAISLVGNPGCTVCVKLADEYRLEFVAIETVAYADGSVGFIDEAAHSNSPVPQLPEAAFMTGELKWDGCMNLTFPGLDHCLLHFCSRENAQMIDRVFEYVYSCGCMIPNWDGD